MRHQRPRPAAAGRRATATAILTIGGGGGGGGSGGKGTLPKTAQQGESRSAARRQRSHRALLWIGLLLMCAGCIALLPIQLPSVGFSRGSSRPSDRSVPPHQPQSSQQPDAAGLKQQQQQEVGQTPSKAAGAAAAAAGAAKVSSRFLDVPIDIAAEDDDDDDDAVGYFQSYQLNSRPASRPAAAAAAAAAGARPGSRIPTPTRPSSAAVEDAAAAVAAAAGEAALRSSGLPTAMTARDIQRLAAATAAAITAADEAAEAAALKLAADSSTSTRSTISTSSSGSSSSSSGSGGRTENSSSGQQQQHKLPQAPNVEVVDLQRPSPRSPVPQRAADAPAAAGAKDPSVSVVIMNWSKPDSVRQILDALVMMEGVVDEVIVLHLRPDTAFEVSASGVRRRVGDGWCASSHQSARRRFFCLLQHARSTNPTQPSFPRSKPPNTTPKTHTVRPQDSPPPDRLPSRHPLWPQ